MPSERRESGEGASRERERECVCVCGRERSEIKQTHTHTHTEREREKEKRKKERSTTQRRPHSPCQGRSAVFRPPAVQRTRGQCCGVRRGSEQQQQQWREQRADRRQRPFQHHHPGPLPLSQLSAALRPNGATRSGRGALRSIYWRKRAASAV